ncbi:MAG: hypothetical protein K2Y27_35190 [Xanthobacteraceae bacterium]|nr:hypothetical protein [Xanthobacteraceae bacterium]
MLVGGYLHRWLLSANLDFMPGIVSVESRSDEGITVRLAADRRIGVGWVPDPPMTVAALIEWLSKQPADAKAYWDEYEFGEHNFTHHFLMAVDRDGPAELVNFNR